MADALTGNKLLRVSVLRDRYPTAFSSPRHSRHDVRRRLFVPFNKIRAKLDGFTLMQPFDGADLVHVVNRIPFGARRMICSFESHIPRQFGLPGDAILTKMMLREITSNRCRRLVGMSHFAKRTALAMHEGTPAYDVIKAKMMVQHPNVELGQEGDRLKDDDGKTLILTFVGGHFVRKGGCVAVRIAEKALEQGLPIHVNIISSMQAGESVWSDPTDPAFLKKYTDLLSLPNVTHFEGLPNADAREVMGKSHFTLLPTFEDTFGFSAIESMAEYTPVIGTSVCALPEVIYPGRNGFLLHLERDELGEWVRPDKSERHTEAYTRLYDDTIETLADEALDHLRPLIGKPELLAGMRADARYTAEEMFSADVAGPRWDDLYERVSRESTGTPAVCDPVLDQSSPESPAFLFEGKPFGMR
ncbi:glycosyltransferase family 4 protein [uncultured Hyphomonas sp.]|uniref:glycosyltransferase family 4 protein n=1 Tax=uncultured Hyphomonas sp. TaxID=225298 RepID=UPI002AAB1D02|nr:glycosyltransferase family 4 protein [uncultured Hyphomonas sp.]